MSDSLLSYGLSAPQAPLSMGILQARTREWVVLPSSRGSSQPRDRTSSLKSPGLAGRSLPLAPCGKSSSENRYCTLRFYGYICFMVHYLCIFYLNSYEIQEKKNWKKKNPFSYEGWLIPLKSFLLIHCSYYTLGCWYTNILFILFQYSFLFSNCP